MKKAFVLTALTILLSCSAYAQIAPPGSGNNPAVPIPAWILISLAATGLGMHVRQDQKKG